MKMVGRFTDQIEGEEDKPGVAATGAVVVARGAGPSAGSRAARGELEARTRAGSVAAVGPSAGASCGARGCAGSLSSARGAEGAHEAGLRRRAGAGGRAGAAHEG